MNDPDERRALVSRLPPWLRHRANRLYGCWYDTLDFLAECVGWVPSHTMRLFFYRTLLRVQIDAQTSKFLS